jgi:hypothetical protein
MKSVQLAAGPIDKVGTQLWFVSLKDPIKIELDEKINHTTMEL